MVDVLLANMEAVFNVILGCSEREEGSHDMLKKSLEL